MSLTQAEIDAIRAAQTEAVNAVNVPGEPEVFYPIPGNFEVLRRLVASERVAQNLLTSPVIWTSAILQARASGLLTKRPTRAELERQRERDDRADGRQKFIKDGDGHESPKGIDPFKQTKDFLQNLMNPATDAPAGSSAKVQFPPYDQDVQDMSPEHRKMFQSLSATDMKAWMKHRAVVKHREQYGLDPKTA